MGNHWKELIPVDRYIVQSNGMIRPDDLRAVTMLYQPLVGSRAYSLYMTLFSELGTDVLTSEPTTHHSLMNHTQQNLQTIYDERKKLEAIGLLKTYEKQNDEDRLFIYEIQPALDPENFFNDDVLSIYLYGRLGKQRYVEMKKRFTYIPNEVTGYKDVTASFNEVFTSLHASEIRSGTSEGGLETDPDVRFYKHQSGHRPEFSEGDFDFDTLVRDLSSFIIPEEVMTAELKSAIQRLAYIYKISPLDMSSIVQQAYFRDEQVTASSLRKETQRWYKIEKPGQLPKLSERSQVHADEAIDETGEPETPEDKMAKVFETISPRTLLEKYSEGGRAASSDLKLIETIMFEQQLPAGVVNVLIDYVLNTNDMKLVHGHVEKIASQWRRKKVKTVREAMTLAQAEHHNYQSFQQQKTKRPPYRQNRKEVRRDKLPKWMTSKNTKQSQSEEQPVSENEKKWLDDYLKSL